MSSPFRFRPLFFLKSSPDPKKERARKAFLAITAAQILLSLILLGIVGVMIWRILAFYR